jgi:transcription elongation factor SPT5
MILLKVRTSQVQESAEIASGQDKLAGYELHDLVVLSGGGATNEVGVIVRVGREEFTVVNNHGIIREVRPEELRGKRNSTSARAVALDVQGNQIRVGDGVTIVEGPFKGRNATIKRMSRAQLFLYSQTKQDNAGIFVVRSRSCALAGSRGKGQNVDNVVTSLGRDHGGRNKKDDNLIGKTVRIQSGQWKGYLGCVSDVTATHVQVELHSRLKKVMVSRDRVTVAGDRFGATGSSNKSDANANMMAAGGMTPFLGGGSTPMHGGATPMHTGGGATPMHDGFGAGGMTPSYGNPESDVWRPGYNDAPDTLSKRNAPTGDLSSLAQSDTSERLTTSNSSGWRAPNADQVSNWNSSKNDASKIGERQPQQSNTQTSKVSMSTSDGFVGSRGEASATVDGGIDPSSAEAAVWFMERVCVQLNRGSDSLSGVIKEINSENSAVVELADKSTVTVRSSEVSLIPPKEHDMVLVTGGADVGVEGELVCIDGSDAILKDSNEDFKIVDLIHLAKIEVEV